MGRVGLVRSVWPAHGVLSHPAGTVAPDGRSGRRRGRTTMSAPVVERPAAAAGGEVVVPFHEVLTAGGLADARWLLHDALLSGARTVVVDLARVPALPPGSL